MNKPDLYAVDGSVKESGSITYGTFSGETSNSTLYDAALSAGLDPQHLPSLPAPSIARRRALDTLKNADRRVEPLDDGGLALVAVDRKDADLDFTVSARVYINDDKDVVIEPFNHVHAEQIRDAYRHAKNTYTAADISAWVIKQMRRLNAVTLRDKGGVYFVPRDKKAEFEKIINTVHACASHKIHRIPAMDSEETVAAVLDAVVTEAAKAAKKMEAELEAMQSAKKEDQLGAQALTNRLERLDGLKRKLESYEKLLGVKMGDIATRLEDVRGNVAMASLALTAEADAGEAPTKLFG
jgi:hypothetical protein